MASAGRGNTRPRASLGSLIGFRQKTKNTPEQSMIALV